MLDNMLEFASVQRLRIVRFRLFCLIVFTEVTTNDLISIGFKVLSKFFGDFKARVTRKAFMIGVTFGSK